MGKNYAHELAQYKEHRPDIVFMGDSCTRLGTYHEKFMKLVQQRHEHSTLQTDGVFGEVGYSSYQGLHQLQRDVLPLHPKIITYYYGWNDHWQAYGLEDKVIGELNVFPIEFLDRFRLGQLILKLFISSIKAD